MRPLLVIAVAGIPGEIGHDFAEKFKKLVPRTSILSWLPIGISNSYTSPYARRLYEQVASKLRKWERSTGFDPLLSANFVLIYLDKEDGRESVFMEQFGVEALIAPIGHPDIFNFLLATQNQRQHVSNALVREGERAIKRVQKLLSVIAEEVTNRDNHTCLLLPRKNFGPQINRILNCVRDAASVGAGGKKFRRDIDKVTRRLSTARDGQHTYFVGRGRMIFKSPGKARGRHGLAPGWDAPGHDLSCVIRGRMRFGASYNPKFHYDCAITKGASGRFPSCHGEETVRRGRTHVNIAPNDNVR